MTVSNIIELIAILICLSLSAFFSSGETAITSTNFLKIKQMEKNGEKNAPVLKKLVDNMQSLLTTILVGNNIVNILMTTLATILFTDILGAKGPIVSTIVITLVVLIFGEITPKTLASSNSEKIALKASKPLLFFMTSLKPLSFILSKITNLIIKLFVVENENKNEITTDDIKTLVGVSQEQGVLNDEEKEIINNVFDFGDNDAADIMTPRTDMESIQADITFEELEEFLLNSKHSRIPVYGENIDNIIGILHMKDLVNAILKSKKLDLRKLVRPTFFAYEYMPILDLFKIMKKDNISLAVIIDEYGGTSGVVSIEDIVEELVGEIDDEYDSKNDEIKQISKNEYIVDPSMNIDDVNDYFNINIEELKSDSIGGFVIDNLERLPKKNDKIIVDDIEFTIEDMKRYKIIKLKMKFLKKA
ncbi:MAG: hemolysin family protein [Peptoniphilaceae bacterium]|nr:hemolysin family protein [Peptoniphilaceae bacterium]MDD7383081.1 hemolysin family protein [Peptoniphilaceae bacterium]MDY3737516.1 hemolysin family protein [Peptoniphilaceae bacterium]